MVVIRLTLNSIIIGIVGMSGVEECLNECAASTELHETGTN